MTFYYASIEQINEEKAHSSFDIWSSGILLYVLMAKKLPYSTKNYAERIIEIKS